MLQSAGRLWLWPPSRRGKWLNRPPAALTAVLAKRYTAQLKLQATALTPCAER